MLIVDGHAYAYRAFHAIRELRSPTGQPTNAIYGFIKMLGKIRAGLRPTHLIVVWDGGLCERRTTMLPDYKAHRPEMPSDLKSQLNGIQEYLEAAGISSYCGQGVEADDYIACLARKAEQVGVNVVIASSDKDFMQLVSARIGLLNPNDKTEAVWTSEEVRQKTGLEPEQIVDWLSLRGDNVDNIAGVPGVGPKTATDLLKQFGSIQTLYERIDEVKSERLRTALRDSAEIVRRNREMVRLREDLPCLYSLTDLQEKPSQVQRLRELYQGWGFKGLLAALGGMTGESQAVLI